MTIWLLPGNTKFYNHLNAFKELKILDWKQRNKYNINDIVFIYTTKPYQKIMVKAIVEQIDIPFSQYIDDSKYWVIKPQIEEQQKYKYVRFRLLQFCDSNKLSLINLQKNKFLINAPQSPQKINENFYNFIDKIFEEENL